MREIGAMSPGLQILVLAACPDIQGEIIYPPPLPPFLAKSHFSEEGGGGCIF